MWVGTPPSRLGYVFSAYLRAAYADASHVIGSVNLSQHTMAIWVIQCWEYRRLSQLSNDLEIALTSSPPDKALSALNNALCRANNKYVCAEVMVLDQSNHTISFTSAGLEGLELWTLDDQIVLPDHSTSGVPLGVIPSFVYETHILALPPQTTAIWVSPLTTQVVNSKGELYAFRGLRKQLQAVPRAPVLFIEYLINDIDKFIGDGELRDDLCVICAQRTD